MNKRKAKTSKQKLFHYSPNTLKIKTEHKGFGFLKTACLLFLILLQFTLFVLTHLYLQSFFKSLAILSVALSFISCLFVLTSNKNSQSKATWIIFLLICSSFGFIVYFISDERFFFYKHSKRYKSILEESSKYSILNKDITQDAETINTLNYFYNVGKFCAYQNTIGKYFSNATDFFDNIIEDIRNAKSFIFIEFFIISDGVLLERILDLLKERVIYGVDVRIIYDDLGSYGTLKRETIKRIKKEGIRIYPFNKLLSKFSVFLNYRDHRKFVIIDGKIGYIGGANLADEYVGKKQLHGYWKDSTMRLDGPAVDGLTLSFLRQWSFVSKTKVEYSNYINLANSNKNPSIYIPFTDGLEYKDNVGKNAYINLICSAKERLYIFTPYLVIDGTLLELIETKAKSGVDVRIILPEIPDKKLVYVISRANAEKLYKSDVKIYFMKDSFVHSKVVLNEKFAVIGSINMDLRSFYQQFENAVLTNDKTVLDSIEEDFYNCINKSEQLTCEKMQSKKFLFKILAMLLNLLAPFM